MKATHRHPPRLTDHAARLSRCVLDGPNHPAYSPGASIALWGTRPRRFDQGGRLGNTHSDNDADRHPWKIPGVAFRFLPSSSRQASRLLSRSLDCNMHHRGYQDRSFYCSGKRRVARQAKDHPEGLPTAWHTTWRSPFREKSGPGGQAHLHTTLNKSRDEKLDLAGPGCGNGSGKRPGVIGARARLPDGRCAQCLSAGKKRRLHLGSNQGPIG